MTLNPVRRTPFRSRVDLDMAVRLLPKRPGVTIPTSTEYRDLCLQPLGPLFPASNPTNNYRPSIQDVVLELLRWPGPAIPVPCLLGTAWVQISPSRFCRGHLYILYVLVRSLYKLLSCAVRVPHARLPTPWLTVSTLSSTSFTQVDRRHARAVVQDICPACFRAFLELMQESGMPMVGQENRPANHHAPVGQSASNSSCQCVWVDPWVRARMCIVRIQVRFETGYMPAFKTGEGFSRTAEMSPSSVS